MVGKLPSLPGESPTLNDLTEIYPEVCYLGTTIPFSENFIFLDAIA